MDHRTLAIASLSAIAGLTTLPASADWFGGVDFGTASMSESGSFGVPVAGFGGPTVSRPICGGTAVITVGAQATVNSIDSSSTQYRVFVGARSGAWGLEAARFNVSRLSGNASAGAYAVAQPTCNPVLVNPITLAAEGRTLATVAFDGFSFTPVYSWEFSEDWTLDLRATVAFWDREDRAEWQIVATEIQSGNPLQTYVTAAVEDQGGGSGVDLWPGLGVSYEMKEGVYLRGIVEQQNFGELSTTSWSLGIAIDFD